MVVRSIGKVTGFSEVVRAIGIPMETVVERAYLARYGKVLDSLILF